MTNKMRLRGFFVVTSACTSICVCLSALEVMGQVTWIDWVEVDNSVGDNPQDEFDPSRHVTSDLLLDFSGQFSGTQLLLELTSGSIYQDRHGSVTPPNQLLIDVPGFESLRFDTFIAQGGPTSDGSAAQTPGAGGGAVGLGGGAMAQFDDERINQAWNPASGIAIIDQADFQVARVTLTDDAVGTWAIKSSAAGQLTFADGIVYNGHVDYSAAGDYSRDGVVSQLDLDLVLLNWGRPARPVPDFWMGSRPRGLVSQNELDAVLLNWGNRLLANGDSVAIPEPGAAGLALVAALAAWVLRKGHSTRPSPSRFTLRPIHSSTAL